MKNTNAGHSTADNYSVDGNPKEEFGVVAVIALPLRLRRGPRR
jgi:hypothetical protein